MKTKILIVRFSSIGDIVLTTPVIRCLKQQVEGAEVHYATKKAFASIVANNPYVDKVHLLDTKLADLVLALKAEQFDYMIDLHHNLRTRILKLRLGVKTFSFSKLNFEKWLMVAFKKNWLPNTHIVDRYLAACSHFNIRNDKQGLDFFISASNEVDICKLPVTFHEKYTALVVGAKHATKQLPVNKLAELCNNISSPVILLGGNEDKEKAAQVVEQSANKRIYNACGSYNLQQSASVIKQAKVVIAHDTGLMHIAAALKKTIISVWGNTIPQFGMYPYVPGKEQLTFEVKHLGCRPCSKIGYKKCPRGHFDCMNYQDLWKIATTCNQLLRSTVVEAE